MARAIESRILSRLLLAESGPSAATAHDPKRPILLIPPH